MKRFLAVLCLCALAPLAQGQDNALASYALRFTPDESSVAGPLLRRTPDGLFAQDYSGPDVWWLTITNETWGTFNSYYFSNYLGVVDAAAVQTNSFSGTVGTLYPWSLPYLQLERQGSLSATGFYAFYVSVDVLFTDGHRAIIPSQRLHLGGGYCEALWAWELVIAPSQDYASLTFSLIYQDNRAMPWWMSDASRQPALYEDLNPVTGFKELLVRVSGAGAAKPVLFEGLDAFANPPAPQPWSPQYSAQLDALGGLSYSLGPVQELGLGQKFFRAYLVPMP